MSDPERFGMIAAFETPEALFAAASRARERGLTGLDAFTPYPVTGLPELIGVRKSRIPIWAFIGGAIGGLGIVGLMLYSTTIAYPINVGGRPLDSWTAFAVEGFECIVLGAAIVAFFGMLAGNRLPRLYHPVFNATSFSLASGDRFYLLVRADDPAFDRAHLRRLFRSWHAVSVEDVEA
ncbi:MAG TPA: DUF3341 domain-containing protein [Hyphomicrobiaceae bacterium]|nr:DUF3341 domain-containing protein [Hyphomicrobiaceae bacterium]